MTAAKLLPAAKLLDLAKRVEQLPGPDGHLDAEIDCAVRFHRYRPARPEDYEEYCRGFSPQPGDIWTPTGFLMASRYTSSVDDALTLIPAGRHWRWLLDRRAFANHRTDGYRAEVTLSGVIEPDDCQVWAATPAIALTASALRALSIAQDAKEALLA